ncbi:MAG: hypothetical protein PHW46_01360 [Candidatus Omnitrophica bacterium]|nr:hypothetical protein [Candidatus Omnitrophota bacterium]
MEKRYYREDGSIEQFQKYDGDDHKIAEAYFDEEGKLEENADGWAAMRTKYQEERMIAEGYYGEDGKLKEFKRYNSEGDLVAKKYVGDNIDPDEEYGTPPTVAGESISYYDTSGRLEGTTSVEENDPVWLFPYWWNIND